MIGTRVLISIASGAACLTLLATLLSAQEPSSRPELVANPSGKGVNLARSEESFS